MALARDLSHLPAGTARQADGTPPDPQPRFGHLLAARWQHTDVTDGPRPFAEPTRIRHSWSGKCAREISLHIHGAPVEPMDLAGIWTVNLGRVIHDLWGAALQAAHPDAEVEVACRVEGLDASGHADALLPDGRRIAVEVKTIGGFGYKCAIGARGAAEGPRPDHLAQAAVNGLALDADEVVVVYLSREALSVAEAKRARLDETGRFCAEWTYPRDDYVPIAQAEVRRLQRILDLADRGELAPTQIPTLPRGARIVDPSTGTWEQRDRGQIVDMGTSWHCGYCPVQKACVAVGSPGIVPAESALAGVS